MISQARISTRIAPARLGVAVIVALTVLAACKRDEQPGAAHADARTSPRADARLAAPDDARPVDAPPAPAKPDAAPAVDAGAPRGKPARPPVDAAAPTAPRPPIDAAAPPPAADAGPIASSPCRRTTFDTTLIADACAAGGQAEAKRVMKAFVRTAKKRDASLDCKGCHDKLAPEYPLKSDALERFEQLGGT